MATHDADTSSERAAKIRRRHDAARTPDQDGGATEHPLLTLQRRIGNAQVARMLAQRQTERLADEIQRSVAVQRDQDTEEIQLQRDAPEVGLAGGPISDGLAQRIQTQRGGGSRMDDTLRADMETSFGARFADVRLHTNSESGSINRSLGAKAFTTGSDIFFGQGASPSDRKLLAHELTHVVQQRSMSTSGAMTVGPAGDSYEQEADAVAARVTSGAISSAQRQAEEE